MTLLTFRDTTISTQRPRREATAVDTIIIHAMSEYVVSDGRTIFAMDFLNEIQLGAHYFIAPDGLVIKGVAPEFRTPHVGKSVHLGRNWLNETSIGIEFLIQGINTYTEFVTTLRVGDPFTDEQYKAGGELIAKLKTTFPSIVQRIVGHSNVSGDDVRGDGRGKVDPGQHFNWEGLTAQIEEAEFEGGITINWGDNN